MAAVSLRATVTLVDEDRSLIVLQDDSGTMAVQTPLTGLTLKPGQQIKVEGNNLSQYVRAFPAYPDQPSTREYLQSFETPSGLGTHYLTRIRGRLHPPVSGQYTFWTSADDACELFLGSDATPARTKRIAMNRIGNATGPREWDRYPPQRSQPVTLQAGEAYYIEAVHLQGYGHDDFAVAWEGPGFKRTVIPATCLSPWRENSLTSPLPSGDSTVTNGLLCERWHGFMLREFEALRPRNPHESFARLGEPRVIVTGDPGLPPPLVLNADDGLNAASNLTWVELEGEVEFAGSNNRGAQITLRLEDRTLQARVLAWPGTPPKDITGSRVKIRGVLEHSYGPKGEWLDSVLWVSDRRDVEIVASALGVSAATPQVPICEIEPSNPQMSWGRRVKVRGRIVGTTNGLVLMEGYDNYQAQCSADGRNWITIGQAVEPWMNDPVLTGLALASRHNQNAAIANFDRLSGWGTNWISTDVGNPTRPGVFSASEEQLRLQSVSRQISERADQCFFVHQATTGPGEFSAHAELQLQPTIQTQFGLMTRESVESRAPYVAILSSPARGPVLQYRRSAGELSVGFASRPELAQHRWLKLIKRKSRLLVQGNPDAVSNWDQELEITGVVTWQNDVPVLSDAAFGPATTAISNLMNQAGTLELRPSIASFVAKAQHPPEPFLANRLAADRLKGVITFSGRVQGTNLLFVQQGNDSGIQVGWPDNHIAPSFQVGQMVEMSGNADVRKSPVVLEPQSFKATGWGRLPEPASYSATLVNNGSGQSRWVQAAGVVRSGDTNGALRLMTPDGLLRIWIGQSPSAAGFGDYSDSAIRVRGVLTLLPDQTPTLLVPSFEFVEIREEPPADPFAIPRFSMAQLGTLESKPEQQRRMKLAGVVTCRLPQGIFVQDETGGAFLQTGAVDSFKVGDPVEAVGFPVVDASSVTLVDVKLRRTTGKPNAMPSPTVISRKEQLEEDRLTQTLVNLTPWLIEQHNKQEGQLLTLQLGTLVFEAALLTNDSGRLPELPVGSRVSISGVLQINPSAARNGITNPKTINAASPFTLWLRQATDVVVLERPPWWTLKRLALVGGLSVCGLLAALLWVRTLRRRVAQKTAELQVAMNRLEKETRTSAVLAERDRLAGEIHDSLQQGLAAIMLQLDAANKQTANSPEARQLLRMARSMAEFSRAEVEHAVWDLQSPLLNNADLGTALTHVASLISTGTPQVTVEIREQRRPLPSTVEHHLLRIAQEAITNAVKHAQAKTILVTLDYSGAELELCVKDDGRGFAPETVKTGAQTGHFGLQGIRARAKKINAQLDVVSQPGQGTTITLRLRLNSDHATVEPSVTTAS